MTGNDIVSLALRNAGVTGVGQVPLTQDLDDALSVLNAWIGEINLERVNKVNPVVCPTFPDLTTEVPFWEPYWHVLLTSMAVRLREVYALPTVDIDVKLAALALDAFNNINLQHVSAPTIAANDETGYGIIYLALRTAGRVADGQGVLQSSQDVTDAESLLNEMLDEWNRERAVKVIPGLLPFILDLAAPLTLTQGQRNAVVLNLGVRLRDWFGAEPSKPLIDRADRALALIQAINLQQNPAPSIATNDFSGYGLVYLALRAAGRVTDDQGVQQGSQDVNDAGLLLNEMMDEWNQERVVKVIPGTLPTFPTLSTAVFLSTGVRNAIVLNLAVRLRDWFGAEVSKTLLDRAERALALIQAINQQQIAPLHAGVPSTAQQVVFLALRMAGRITDTQSVADTSKDVNDAFSLLVMMLGQWQRKRWLIWNEQEVSLVSNGAQSYTIGPGSQFNTARPDKIQAAWCRLMPFAGPNPVDLPLSIIEAKEDWARITIKDLRSIPAAVFYDSSYPVGQVYFWPVPIAAQYEMHLVVKATLPVPASVTAPMAFPPEYLDAVVNNLACRILVASGQPISPFLLGQAKASLETVRMANSQIALLGMPSALSGYRSGDASSWAGQGLNDAWVVGGVCTLS